MGVLTDFFRASENELRAHYPSWKVPLSEPRRVSMRNPFTNQTIEVPDWNPSPDVPVDDAGPLQHPGPSIDMKGLSETSVASLMAIVHDETTVARELFDRPALIGPEDGPWIRQLPPPFVEKLAKLDAPALDAVAARWSEVERADMASIKNEATAARMLDRAPLAYWRDVLNVLAKFARETVAEDKNMYLWMSL